MPQVTIEHAQAANSTHLQVTSQAFKDGQPIPDAYSAYGNNVVPGLNWTRGPAGTLSYTVIVEDPAAQQPRPVVHWIAYDIPPTATMLPLPGLHQGRNHNGEAAYAGPHPPAGDPPHPYHFQVFALDTLLGLPDGASLDQITAAMQGHILADGEIVGTYQATQH